MCQRVKLENFVGLSKCDGMDFKFSDRRFAAENEGL